MIFIIGLTAATFATTDLALTALTTSFFVDFLNFHKKEDPNDSRMVKKRTLVHVAFSFIMLLVILGFRMINDDSVVTAIFTAAGYTYGPLLGLFVFGMFTKRSVADPWVPYICILSPILLYLLKLVLAKYAAYGMSFELIVINAFITWVMLFATSKKGSPAAVDAKS